jgi:hypothetical protein
MKAFAQDAAISDDYGSDDRIRCGRSAPTSGEFAGAPHEQYIA